MVHKLLLEDSFNGREKKIRNNGKEKIAGVKITCLKHLNYYLWLQENLIEKYKKQQQQNH